MLRRVENPEDSRKLTAEELLAMGDGTTAVDDDGDLACVMSVHDGGPSIVFLTYGDEHGFVAAATNVGYYGPFTLCDIEVRRVG